MPTGSAESLCFQILALIMEGLTVVVSPLVALMEDQLAALRLPDPLFFTGTINDRTDAHSPIEITDAAFRHRRSALHFSLRPCVSHGITRPSESKRSLPQCSCGSFDGHSRRLAQNNKVPLDVIFPDKTLADMSQR